MYTEEPDIERLLEGEIKSWEIQRKIQGSADQLLEKYWAPAKMLSVEVGGDQPGKVTAKC